MLEEDVAGVVEEDEDDEGDVKVVELDESDPANVTIAVGCTCCVWCTVVVEVYDGAILRL